MISFHLISPISLRCRVSFGELTGGGPLLEPCDFLAGHVDAMLQVTIQPRFLQRQPVADVMPNDSRNLSNKIIGLAVSRELSSGFLSMFSTA
jgi:hypothetical protein